MAGGRLTLPAIEPVLDANGHPVAGATLDVYQNRTTTHVTLYTDEALTTPAANPQSGVNASNASGLFYAQSNSLWLDSSALYSVKLVRPTGETTTYNDISVAAVGSTSTSYATRAAAAAATILAATAFLYVQGYAAAGDGGAGLYAPAAAGAGAGKFASADGQWWVLSETRIDPRMLGAKGDGATDDTSAIVAANSLAASSGKAVVFDGGTYKLTTTQAFTAPVIFEGGAKLSLATGVTASFSAGLSSPAWPQIFVLAGTAAVQIAAMPVSVRWFGAKGDGATDDTAAFAAAIAAVSATAGGTVYLPVAPVAYKTTATIGITTPALQILGHGWASLWKPTNTTTDVIHAYPASGANLSGFRMTDVVMYSAASNPSAGALVHLDRCNGFRIEGGAYQAYYGSLLIDGSVHGFIDCDLQSDANFTGLAAGSYLCKFQQGSDGTIPAEIHIAKADWRGQTGNNYLDYAILITCCDGLFFENIHYGFCRTGLAMAPATDTSNVTAVVMRGAYADTCSINLVAVTRPSPTYAGSFGGHNLDFAEMFNAGGDGVQWFMHTANAQWNTLNVGNMSHIGASGINIGLGEKINILAGFSMSGVSYVTAGSWGIVLNGGTSPGVTDINIGRGVIEKGLSGNTPAAGLQATVGVTAFTVDVLRVRNCTATITDTSGAVNKSLAAALAY